MPRFYGNSNLLVRGLPAHPPHLGNSLGDRLHAFEPRGGIEIRALLAAVQFEGAARALALGIKTLLQDGTAI